jgi:hypothetical protein
MITIKGYNSFRKRKKLKIIKIRKVSNLYLNLFSYKDTKNHMKWKNQSYQVQEKN